MEEKEQPNYYAIIPADVRYCDKLVPNEKLLYGEITSLCNKSGKCFAQNSYFAKLYNVENTTVSRWISHLEKNGFITTEIEYKEGTRQIVNRYIQINQYPIDKKINTPIDKNVKENNKNINNTSINNKILLKENSIKEIFDYWNSKGIIEHKKLNDTYKSAILTTLKEYSVEEIKSAIDHYHIMLNDKDYNLCSYIWSIDKFLRQKNALMEFTDNGSKWLNYQNTINNIKDKEQDKPKSDNKPMSMNDKFKIAINNVMNGGK